MERIIKVPEIEVGICSGEELGFTLHGQYHESSSDISFEGHWKAKCNDIAILLENKDHNVSRKNSVMLEPVDPDNSSFIIQAVTIGVNFHWQRKEDQVFKGNLKLITEDGKLTIVNVLSIEDYLVSVISSEMRATSSLELLKAHAVISRSWLMAQIEKSKSLVKDILGYESYIRTDNEIIKWYDREDHRNYDVCADDHCQRYQGITRASTPIVVKAIEETFGEVLTYSGNICDTRYSKCCGGITELFRNVWEPVDHPYLTKVIDFSSAPEGYDVNLDSEDIARKWINGKPDAFCNSSDKKVLSQVLNDYDQETNDFYRWKVTYEQNELSDLINTRTGIDFGIVLNLIPLERGVSGRIKRLKIEGTRKTMIIGKELEIRKALSKTHLYSSCFFVEKLEERNSVTFVLHGAGWGHGVGLCQIGAAVMGAKGYSYREILDHYFKNATLEKRY